MSAASPAPFTPGFMSPQAPRARLVDLQTPRGQHIPSWYNAAIHYEFDPTDATKPLSGPEAITVTMDGLPLLGYDKEPFTVAEVPVERRYAIQAGGEVLPQAEFKARYCDRILEFYTLKKEEVPDVRYDGKVENEAIPAVQNYVSEMVDPENEERVIEMHFNPYATEGAVPETLTSFDEKGKESERPRIEVLMESYVNPKMRRLMSEREVADVEEHMRSLLDLSVPVEGPGDEAEEEIPDEAAVVPKAPKKKGAPMTTAACGKKVLNLQIKKHRASCPVCRKAAA